MLVSREEAERRLNSSQNLVNSLRVNDPTALRTDEITEDSPTVQHRDTNNRHRSPEVPEFLRVIAGTLAHTETAKSVGNELGISPYTVHGYKHGKLGDSTVGQRVEPEFKSKIDNAVNGARDVAVTKLMEALGLITVEKMSKTNAKDLSTIASNMARVVEKTSLRSEKTEAAQIIIYAPQIKTEDRYKTVEI